MAQTILYDVRELIPHLQGKRVLLVHGGSYARLSLSGVLTPICAAEFTGFTPNPRFEQAVEGARVFRQNRCDAILAVGGGSAMDIGKAIRFLANTQPEDCRCDAPVTDTGIPLYAIPTTAGSGAESTRYCVIYEKGEKQSISDPCLVPRVILLDGGVLESLPLYQKKCTFLDALCQAVEALWSVNSTEASTRLAREAAILLRDHWREYIFENTAAARDAIMKGSNLSGQAINITSTTAGHAMSYKLTTTYGLPHGHAVALSMNRVWPHILTHTAACNDPRGEEYLKRALAELPVAYEEFHEMLRETGMLHPDCRPDPSVAPQLAAGVKLNRLKNHPVTLTQEEITAMYADLLRDIAEGTDR